MQLPIQRNCISVGGALIFEKSVTFSKYKRILDFLLLWIKAGNHNRAGSASSLATAKFAPC